MDDDELATELIESFLQDTPLQIDMLKSLFGSGDAGGVEKQAHQIKGAASAVSGARLFTVARAAEEFGRAADMPALSTAVAEIEVQFDCLKQVLMRELDRNRETGIAT